MKKYLLFFVMMMCFSITTTFAQGSEGARQTPEERATAVMEKLAPLKLDALAYEQAKTVFLNSFNEQQKVMSEMRSSGNMDRDAMMAKRKEMNEARNEKLKKIFTADQMKQWIDEIEPSLRPQRRSN